VKSEEWFRLTPESEKGKVKSEKLWFALHGNAFFLRLAT
jgi:hypothetical protein